MRTITVNKWFKGEDNKEKVTWLSGLLLFCLSGKDLSFCTSPASAGSYVLPAERAHPSFTNPSISIFSVVNEICLTPFFSH